MKLMELQHIVARQIKGTEFEQNTYFAGGCVRDWLIDHETELKEADLCVEMKQGGILLAEKLYKELKGNSFVLHPSFGTAGFSFQDINLEFVATRKEVYRQDSRFPKVSYGSLLDDVLRRDFTINSLLMRVGKSEVIDLSGQGIPDLKAGLIRCLGDPATKYVEDPLRLVRALRFSLKLGFTLEQETQRAWEENGFLVNKLSQRAINAELAKLEPGMRDKLHEILNSYSD
jgi:tRNA nucleotidyltransferase/poly(A) polymerase